MEKNIVIVHYNTPFLTECLVRSINLFVKDAKIYIFDNSDKYPFTAKFDNVTILDNTKGKYINFDKWLEKYPRKTVAVGRLNGWASAKHCYSVEKCMEILNDNFILLDSDILLKKDISDLYDENMLYCAEEVTQPRVNVKRILPYVCYINVKKCREKNIHYFNDEYILGLNRLSKGEKYDTGSYFYLMASKFAHKDIKVDDYAVHYKAASWVEGARKMHHYKQISIDEWLRKYKKYWKTEKNKKVIYTCITGGYDSLIEPSHITVDFDYVCFTDNPNLTSDIWDIRPLPEETKDLSQVKKQRYVKINAHKVLSDYDLSIWVDGNVDIRGDLNKFINKTLSNDCSIYVPKHPQRKCIYVEAQACVSMKKDTKEIVNKQIDKYKEEGFPQNYGLLQSNIMLRKHNNEDCIKLMEAWFEELKNESHRDQLSFNYVSWKNQDIKVIYMDKMIYRSEWFNWRSGHKRAVATRTPRVMTNRTIVPRRTIKENKSTFHSILERKRLSTYKVSIYS